MQIDKNLFILDEDDEETQESPQIEQASEEPEISQEVEESITSNDDHDDEVALSYGETVDESDEIVYDRYYNKDDDDTEENEEEDEIDFEIVNKDEDDATAQDEEETEDENRPETEEETLLRVLDELPSLASHNGVYSPIYTMMSMAFDSGLNIANKSAISKLLQNVPTEDITTVLGTLFNRNTNNDTQRADNLLSRLATVKIVNTQSQTYI